MRETTTTCQLYEYTVKVSRYYKMYDTKTRISINSKSFAALKCTRIIKSFTRFAQCTYTEIWTFDLS